MGNPDGLIWVVDPAGLCLIGVLFIWITFQISTDFLAIEIKPLRLCPTCGRRWVPLPHDSSDSPICNHCSHNITVGPKPKKDKP